MTKPFSDYLVFGAFPRRSNNLSLIAQNSRLSEQVIKDVVKDDIFRKINFDKFFLFTKNILNYIGNEIKVSSSYNDLAIEHRTGKEYLDILINSQILKTISNEKDKNLNSSYKKLYFTDLGLISLFNKHQKPTSEIEGKIAENAVFNFLNDNLNQKFNDHNVFYTRNKKKEEVDFLIPSLKLAIEVKYTSNREYLKMGINNLNSLVSKDYKKIIVTKDIDAEDVINNVKLVSLEKFCSLEILSFK